MDMRVDAARCDDQAFACDDFRRCADDQVGIHTVHRAGVACFADADDFAVTNANIAFDDAPVIDDQGVGDDEIERAVAAGGHSRLTHPVAQGFAAAELGFVTVIGEILLDFDDQVGVGEAHAVAFGRAVEIGVNVSWNAQRHGFLLRKLKVES